MDCRSCGVVNDLGRRYCRECGVRLGQLCPVCDFCNAAEDKHCGGCGRLLKAGAAIPAAEAPTPAYAPAITDDRVFNELEGQLGQALPASGGIPGQDVSQSEIDGLFENILDEDPRESGEGVA